MDSTNDSSSPENQGPPEQSPVKFNFGEWIKSIRNEKKVSLEEIAAVTKVHITQLRSLEENDTSKLPAPAFVRGFLVSYARHLAIDENEVLEKYRKTFGSLNPLADNLMPSHHKAAQSSSAPKVRIVTSPSIKQAPGSKNTSETGPTLINFRTLGMSVVAVSIAALVVFLIMIGRNAKRNNSTPPAEVVSTESATPQVTVDPIKPVEASLPGKPVTESNTTEKPVATAAAKVTTQETAPTPLQTISPAKKYQGEIKAIEPNWVNLRIDDEPSKGFNIKAGTTQTFDAQRKVIFHFSDAGAVEIKWNGIWYSPPGDRGAVRSLTLPDQIETLTVKPIVRIKPTPKPTPVSENPAAESSTQAPPANVVPSTTEE
jgi:cytoskeletal protein RodZ